MKNRIDHHSTGFLNYTRIVRDSCHYVVIYGICLQFRALVLTCNCGSSSHLVLSCVLFKLVLYCLHGFFLSNLIVFPTLLIYFHIRCCPNVASEDYFLVFSTFVLHTFAFKYIYIYIYMYNNKQQQYSNTRF
jgi:hypothetical protein